MKKIEKLLSVIRANLALLLLLLTPVMSFFPGTSREYVLAIVIFVVIALLCLISGISNAISAAKIGLPLPFPGIFWQLLTNTMPSARPSSTPKLKLALALSNQDDVTEFEARLKSDIPSSEIAIERLVLAQSDQKKTEFHKKLVNSDGILYVASKRVNELEYPWQELLTWAAENPGKLVIIIKYKEDTVPTKHAFTVVNDSESLGAALWTVVGHMVKRSAILEHHGRNMHRTLLGYGTFLLILTAVWWHFNNEQRQEINALARLAGKGDSSHAATAMEVDTLVRKVHLVVAGKLLVDMDAPVEVRVLLDRIAQDIQKDLYQRHGLNVTASYGGHVSIWKRVTRDKQDIAVRVGCSSDRKKSSFGINDKSILGGAFRNPNNFIIWRVNAAVGTPAVWSLSGAPFGKFTEVGKIQLDNKMTCSFLDRKGQGTGTDQHIEQLMCFAWAGSAGRADIAISIETPLTDDFLHSEWTRRYLVQIMTYLQVIPDKLLIPKDELKEIFSANVNHD